MRPIHLIPLIFLSLAACNEQTAQPTTVTIDTDSRDISADLTAAQAGEEAASEGERMAGTSEGQSDGGDVGESEENRGGEDKAPQEDPPAHVETFEYLGDITGGMGIMVLQDNRTGCQWIKLNENVLVIRPDPSGRQICLGKTKDYVDEDQVD